MSINFDCKYNINKKNTELKADINSDFGGVGGKCILNENYKVDDLYKGIVLKSTNDYMDFKLELFEDDNQSYSVEALGLLNLKGDYVDGKIGLKYNKDLNRVEEENNISGVLEGALNLTNAKVGLNYETSFDSNYKNTTKKLKQKKSYLTPFIETNFKQFKGRIGYQKEKIVQINKYGSANKYENHYLNMKTDYNI